jgi:hypothetical protein
MQLANSGGMPAPDTITTENYCNGAFLSCRFKVLPYDDSKTTVVPPAGDTDTSPGVSPDASLSHDSHYCTTPALEMEAVEPGAQVVQGLWRNARFPGHFDSGEHYAVAHVSAGKCSGLFHGPSGGACLAVLE